MSRNGYSLSSRVKYEDSASRAAFAFVLRRVCVPPPVSLITASFPVVSIPTCAWCATPHAASSRGVYERALAELSDEEKTEKLFSAFAHFEERCKEYERAR